MRFKNGFANRQLLCCTDINSRGDEIDDIRPSGPDAEHRQPSKSINNEGQKKLRDAKRRAKLVREFNQATVEYKTIQTILERNNVVEGEILEKKNAQSLDDMGIEGFLGLSFPKLKDFIYVRRFVTKTFQESKLAVNGKKLNKTLYKGQSAEMMKEECSMEEPCLVWYAWTIRKEEIVLKCPSLPELDTNLPTPTFEVTRSILINKRRPSEYL